MIGKSGSKSSVQTKQATQSKPATKTPAAKPLANESTSSAKGDKATISAEVKDDKIKNLPNLNALADSLDTKDDKKAGDPAKADEKKEKKFPPEVQAQIDSLEAQLKQAEAKGDQKEIERLKKELEELRNPQAKDPGKGEGSPAASGSDGGSGAPGSGGGSPAAGESSGGGGGGSPDAGGGGGGGGSPDAGGEAAPAGGASEAGPAQEANSEEVKQFLQFAASAYGVNPTLLSEIARRESNFNTGDIANNWDSNAKKGTPSKGMFQFIQPTFESMAPKAKEANPQAWQGVGSSWTDWKAQALTCAWAVSTGQGKHWSTYNSALASAGGSPRA